MIDIPYDMMNKGVGGTSKITPPPYIAAVLIFSPAGFFKKAAAVGDIYTDTDTGQKYKCDLAYASKDEKGNDFTYYLWIKLKNESSGSGGTIDPYIDNIKKNTEHIGLLEEDLSNKITKFYASNHGETHITDSDNGKIQDMIIYGRSSQFTTTGKNLANGQNIKCYINSSKNMCGVTDNDTGMAIDVSKLTNVTISTRSIQDRYRVGCTNTVPTTKAPIACYNGIIKDGTKDSYTIDTTDYNYLIVNATKLEDIQVEKGTEVTSYEPYTGGIPSPSLDYPQEIKRVVNPTVKVTNEDGLKVQSVTLNNIILNAIPVSSGGNVTIDGQQYIADYVDVDRGKVVRMCGRETLNTKNGEINEEYRLVVRPHTPAYEDGSKECIFSTFKWNSWTTCASGSSIYIKNIKKPNNELYTAQELKELSIDFDVVYQLSEKQ